MKKITTYVYFALLLLYGAIAVADSVPVIAAATDLKFALEKISQQFTKDTGQEVMLSFDSSGKVFQQINAQKSAAELFMSSDEKYVLELAEKGLTVDNGVLYGIGRLVLFTPTDSKLKVDNELRGVASDLKTKRLKRFAISNPKYSSYGRAAQEVLMAKGLWEKIQPKLVVADTTMQTAELVSTGTIQAGIFAYSLVFDPQIKGKGKFVLLPEYLHAPIRHRMVLLKDASSTAKDFYDYLQSVPARVIFSEYNFSFMLFRRVDGD
jgi:molybdate transport system substrate-binding protein